MTNNFIRRILACVGFLLAFIILATVSVHASGVQHWYCKRTTNHTQPGIDSDMEWITQCKGIYVDKNHADMDSDKVVYLTFDAGYENGNVEKILNILQKHQVPGAFFILGNLISRNPDLVKRMADEGHLVCNHTYTHKDVTRMTPEKILEELLMLEKAYSELTGRQMDKYFRPPEGTFDQKSLKVIAEHGYKTVFWSFAYADWDNAKQMDKCDAIKKITDNLHNGEIMLLHPTSATNAEILSELIVTLKQMGYRFGTLNELKFEQS